MTIEQFNQLTPGTRIDGRNRGDGTVERNGDALIIRWDRDGAITYALEILRTLWGPWSASPMAHWFIIPPDPRGAIYDYKKQAWIENGRYARCGHSDSDPCTCYGRMHEGAAVVHTQDSDCQVGANGECEICGVLHGDACPTCNGQGFHAADCPDSDANYVPADAQAAVVMLQHAIDHVKSVDVEAVFVLACAIPAVVIDALNSGVYCETR